MDAWRSVWRTVTLLGLFAGASWQLVVQRPSTRKQRAEWLHQFCARAMRRMDIPVTVEGRFPERGAVVSNHLGYLDIVTFAAISPCVFVSKAEIRAWPVLGWMTTMAGTIYVERGRGGSAARAAGQILDAEAAGVPVVFFPEGTTTNGRDLLPFHSGVLSQVLASGQPVTAASIRYSLGPGNGAATVEDDVAYWGEVVLLKHILRFLRLRSVAVAVRFAPEPIAFTAGAKERKRAAAEAREAVQRLANGDLKSPPTVAAQQVART